MTPPVAVAVVSWNTRDLLAACLRSLTPEVQAGRAEVWVVDNASTDGSAQMVREGFPWVSLVEPGENLGFGPAVNLVARRTSSPWIAPANADVELLPGSLEALLAAGAAHPDAAIIAPRLVLPDGSHQHSVHAFPTLALALLFNLGLHRWSRRLADRLALAGRWDASAERAVDWAIAAFLLVRREAFEEVGGFDEGHWLYAEDLDLGWRAFRAGWRTLYAPQAAVRHSSSAAATQAFGEEILVRWMAATYAWMARRRGIARTWLYAGICWSGAALRCALAGALALGAPARFGPTRDYYRRWMRAHATGLRARAALLAASEGPPSRVTQIAKSE